MADRKEPRLGKVNQNPKVMREIAEEWDEYVDSHAYRDEEGQLIWGDSLIRSLGETGLATLRYLAKRGHFESAKVLKETFLGLPEQPFAVRLADKSAQETEVMIMEFFVSVMKLSPASAQALHDRIKRAALEEPELTSPDILPALPEHKPRRARVSRS